MPVIASGDIDSRARAQSVLATTGAAAVMVGRAAQGNPWVLREIMGDDREPSREEVVAELLLFMRETVRELGEQRASGFLKKFYGWYLGRGRFPRPFKQELVLLPHRAARSRRACSQPRPARASCSSGSLGAARPGGRGPARLAADLALRRRLSGTSTYDRDRTPWRRACHLLHRSRLEPSMLQDNAARASTQVARADRSSGH